MQIAVKRSQRRHKTVQARMVDGVLEIAIPGRMSAAEEQHWVEVMRARFTRGQAAAAVDLPRRAAKLAAAYGLTPPHEVVWSERQKTLWGSCTPTTGRVRIATRVAAFPDWVLDYVIVHELAHLTRPDHGPAFWKLVNRYPLAERARGYLLAKNDAAPQGDCD
jgi:predicted metal-dependent hydrolase